MRQRPSEPPALASWRLAAILVAVVAAVGAIWTQVSPDPLSLRCLIKATPALLHCPWCYVALAALITACLPDLRLRLRRAPND